MQKVKTFWRDVLIVVVLSALSAWAVAGQILHQQVPVSFWLSLGFIALVTIIVFRVLLKANQKRPQIFVAYFMGSLTGKLLLSAFLMLGVGMIDPENLKFTAIGFFIVYALLTAVELRNILPIVRG